MSVQDTIYHSVHLKTALFTAICLNSIFKNVRRAAIWTRRTMFWLYSHYTNVSTSTCDYTVQIINASNEVSVETNVQGAASRCITGEYTVVRIHFLHSNIPELLFGEFSRVTQLELFNI